MFAILDVKSSYSFLDGVMSVEEIVTTAKAFNYVSVAINDVTNLHNVMELQASAQKHQIKPLYSLRVTLNDPDEITFLLFAKNNDGYHSLLKYSTLLNSDKAQFTVSEMSMFTNDLIVIVYGEGGIIETENIDTDAYLIKYKAAFNDFYVGISNNASNKWKVDNDRLKLQCYQHNVKTVALPKVEFNKAEDKDLKKLFVALKQNKLFNDHSNYINEKNYFMSMDEIVKYYDAEDISNTIEISNKCNVNFNTYEKAQLPRFNTPSAVSSEQYLTQLCAAGLKRRLNNNVSANYLERLKYELSVINDMGYSDYFLIVYDVILYARKNNIYVGPGRGSSASSLVAYVLGITHIDPIENNLLFERFLNPDRISLPDIDIDFPDNKRQQIIDYVIDKYGSEHVAQIVTFGTFAARQTLRDVGKALMIPPHIVSRLSNMVKLSNQSKLEDVYNNYPKFKKEIDSDNKLKQYYSLAKKVEGLNRHTSLHAAGIIMASKPLSNFVPLTNDNGMNVSQYSMGYLEQIGLNKIDFLGLRNLTIISEITDCIKDFEILKISLDDEKTFRLLQSGSTSGIFQLESYGMTKLIVDMQPKAFTDLVAAIALYRPGPVKNIPAFLKARSNPKAIKYIHPDLEPILKETYGIIVYQEQIMQIAQLMANFSLAKADIMRKAMSSKQSDLLHSLREEFIMGSLKKGYSKKVAIEIYDLIEEFSNYGFNKAHSYAYGLIAYQMAYLKANYYLEFYLALLNGVIGISNKTNEYVSAAKLVNINIFGPNINYSEHKYIKNNNSILFPLTAIKSIGQAVASKIIEERENGLYTDYFDFIARSNLIGISRTQVEALIHSGALDLFNESRTTLLNMLDGAYMYSNIVKVDVDPVYLDFDIVSKPKITKYAKNAFKELENEKEYLGMYLTTHPISQYKQEINYQGDSISQVLKSKNTRQLLGMVNKIKSHTTKFGDLMAFVEIVDEHTEVDIVLMPNVYKLVKDRLKLNQYVVISGKINQKDSILVNGIEIRE